jgi:hypothetical protein
MAVAIRICCGQIRTHFALVFGLVDVMALASVDRKLGRRAARPEACGNS